MAKISNHKIDRFARVIQDRDGFFSRISSQHFAACPFKFLFEH